MYAAYQSGQFSSYPPVRFSCSPWATDARRIALASSSAEPNVVTPVSIRPGSRVVISCTSQELPSGSLKDANEPYVPRSVAAPDTRSSAWKRSPSDRSWNTSETATPRAASPSRAAWASDTIRYTFVAEPGGADVTFVPNWTEHAEPGGVNCTIRKRSPSAASASSRQPRLA